MIKCCRGCVPPKRHRACWDTCPEYKEEKAAEDAKNAHIKRLRYLQRSLDEINIEAAEKAKKGR